MTVSSLQTLAEKCKNSSSLFRDIQRPGLILPVLFLQGQYRAVVRTQFLRSTEEACIFYQVFRSQALSLFPKSEISRFKCLWQTHRSSSVPLVSIEVEKEMILLRSC